MSRLTTYKSALLPWYPTAIVIPSIGDGSCFFHALVLAYCKVYRDGDYNFKVNFVRDLRHQLSLALPEWYNRLSRGQLPSMSKDIPDYTLASMQSELNSS